MNMRIIIFSGIMTALLGGMFGIAIAEITKQPYQCCPTGKMDLGFSRPRRSRIYGIAGAIAGFTVGVVQASLRQTIEENENIEENNDQES